MKTPEEIRAMATEFVKYCKKQKDCSSCPLNAGKTGIRCEVNGPWNYVVKETNKGGEE